MNRVCLLGRLTKDVEMRYGATNNIAVANFTLAVNRRMKKEKMPDADFINCVSFGKTGEFVEKYFAKGLQVAVEGRIQTRNYENNEGRKIYVTEVIADSVYFADSKKDKGDIVPKQDDGDIPYDIDSDELPF